MRVGVGVRVRVGVKVRVGVRAGFVAAVTHLDVLRRG